MEDNSRRLFGYARVSSQSQNVDRQKDALLQYGVLARDIYIDKASGKNFDRPKYAEMKKQLEEGDLVVIVDLDRLGRNYSEMSEEWRIITKDKKCDIEILNFPLLSTTTKDKNEHLENKLIADIVLHLLSYVAERERKDIRERQKAGIESAKRNGVVFGRPRIQKPDDFDGTYEKVLRREITNREAMAELGLKPNTYYGFVDKYRRENGLV